MSAYSIFRFRNHALAVALAAVYPACAQAAGVARVDFVSGPVVAVGASGTQRTLGKGGEVGNGDAVVTGDRGRAQLRFSDGGMVSLQPGTEFKIDDYRYSDQGGEEKGFFSLLKGGMRTITGLIGRSNRSSYQVTTSVATIGIRGTEYTAGLNPAGNELLVHTGEGLVEVCNNAGCMLLGAGESGAVPGRNVEPRRTDARPQLPPAQPETSLLPVYSTADTFTETFNLLGVPTSPMPTTGTASYSTIVSQGAGSAQLTSASLAVDFGALDVTTSLSGLVSAQTFSASGTGAISGNTYSSSLSGFSGSLCSSGCTGSVSGTFFGSSAERVGISYSVSDGFTTSSGSATIGQ